MFSSVVASHDNTPVLMFSAYTVHRVLLERVISKVEVTLKRPGGPSTEGAEGVQQLARDPLCQQQQVEQQAAGSRLVSPDSRQAPPVKRYVCQWFYDHENIAIKGLPAL
jgi:hypothetical protein